MKLIKTLPRATGSVCLFRTSRVIEQLQIWKNELPQIKPYYAVKSNPDPFLLKILHAGEIGFDCASGKEIETVIHSAEIAPLEPKIIFANPCKTERDIKIAEERNVRLTVVDSVEEVEKLSANKWSGSTLVRILVEDSESKCRFSSKFGATQEEVKKISLACSYYKIPLKGVSFHVGSGCRNPLQYEWALNDAYKALQFTSGKCIDIGGGFVSATFPTMAAIIRKNLVPGLHYIAEPGRFFSERSYDLLVKVIGEKPGKKGGYRYTIDESLYGQFSCIPFDHAKPEWKIASYAHGDRNLEYVDGTIFGRTCDSLDLIETGTMPRLHVGDWLLFPNMGAYTSVTASEFNGFPKAEVLYPINKSL